MALTTRSRGVRETHRTERNGTAMKKRLLSILLVFVIVLSTLPIPAFAEDGGEAAPTCICETACTAEAMNEDCPVCGAEGAHLHDCAKYVEGAENPAETTTPTAEPVNVGETEATTAPVVPETEKDETQPESENDAESIEGGEETLPEDAPDTLALDAENLISVQSGETMSDELYDSLSYATFTLSASEYQCGEAGHTGSITDICLNSVDLSDWDANRKIKVNFDISFQCDTPGCPRGKEMNRYNKTRTFTDSDSCHTPVSATANYRKACSSNNNDLIVLTLTSNKSIAYKEYFPKRKPPAPRRAMNPTGCVAAMRTATSAGRYSRMRTAQRSLPRPSRFPRRDTISLQVPITRNCLAPVPISVMWNTGIAASATSILPITPAQRGSRT